MKRVSGRFAVAGLRHSFRSVGVGRRDPRSRRHAVVHERNRADVR